MVVYACDSGAQVKAVEQRPLAIYFSAARGFWRGNEKKYGRAKARVKFSEWRVENDERGSASMRLKRIVQDWEWERGVCYMGLSYPRCG